MNPTHITYKMAKALREFLGSGAPKPLPDSSGMISQYDCDRPEDGLLICPEILDCDFPAYQLHDLLSRPFCEVLSFEIVDMTSDTTTDMEVRQFAEYLQAKLSHIYYSGGLPAVEAELMKMMGGK